MLKKLRFCLSGLVILLTACQPTVNNYYYFPAGKSNIHPSTPPTNSVMAYPIYQSEIKCKITCFSHNAKNAAYSLPANALPAGSKSIYVKGSLMVPGKYDGQRICRPFGYETADISALTEFRGVCQVFVSACRDGSCWAGGN